MNSKYLHATHWTAIVLITLLLGACSKNEIYISTGDKYTDGGNSDGNQGNNSGNPSNDSSALITFSASVEGRTITRSLSAMGKGIQNWLAVYPSNDGNNTNRAPLAAGYYVTSSPGVLSGIQGYKMYLSNNTYNFYAVSTNSSTPPPTFTNGVSDLLSNGVDYLWWNALNQDIKSSQVNIPITYQHAATQIVINITGGENITITKILSATITPPQPGATMDLSTGIITPETAYGKTATMGIKDFTVQYIMLPIIQNSPMPLTLELIVNDENFARTYQTSLPLPDGKLSAGSSYLFRAVINENSVSFPYVSVKSWTEVDESGNPLYPTQD